MNNDKERIFLFAGTTVLLFAMMVPLYLLAYSSGMQLAEAVVIIAMLVLIANIVLLASAPNWSKLITIGQILLRLAAACLLASGILGILQLVRA